MVVFNVTYTRPTKTITMKMQAKHCVKLNKTKTECFEHTIVFNYFLLYILDF